MPTTTPKGRRQGPAKRPERHRIYCAGPLFNRPEQEEMAGIAHTLEGAGFSTFLPQKDGFVFEDIHREFLRGGYDDAEASRMIQRAIFCLDTYEVVSACDGLVLNLNGRVPDEGAVAEAAMAWMANKSIVLYKSDSRSLIRGNDNPLVAGLGNFVKVSTLPEIAYAFTQVFRARRAVSSPAPPRLVRDAVEPGRRLSKALAECQSPADIVPAIVAFARRLPRFCTD
ncbi:MAG TPA: nucleoside 2-deoxyribosyltransferase [Candidatus Methylomirabilis sp.]|nr:nucleoside 2-deoxyribosyltransferase [Candidatus Methylomirabilis sp.]